MIIIIMTPYELITRTTYKLKSKKNRLFKKILVQTIKQKANHYYQKLKFQHKRNKILHLLVLYFYSSKINKKSALNINVKNLQQQINLLERRIDTMLARVGFLNTVKSSSLAIQFKCVLKNNEIVNKNMYSTLYDKIKLNLFIKVKDLFSYKILYNFWLIKRNNHKKKHKNYELDYKTYTLIQLKNPTLKHLQPFQTNFTEKFQKFINLKHPYLYKMY